MTQLLVCGTEDCLPCHSGFLGSAGSRAAAAGWVPGSPCSLGAGWAGGNGSAPGETAGRLRLEWVGGSFLVAIVFLLG